MSGNLVDTNIIIKVLNGDKTVINFFSTLEEIYIAVITVGELCYGASKSSKREYNQKLFDSFINEYSVIDINAFVAQAYGKVKYSLVKQGCNIPENDIWIASTAIANDLTLVTCDQHFKDIEELKSIILE